MGGQQDAAGKAVRHPLEQAYERVLAGMAGLASIWILILMTAISMDVLSGQILNQPIYGVVEITAQSIVAVVFFQLPHAVRCRRLTRADFVIGALGLSRPALAAWLNALYSVAGFLVFAALATRMGPEVIDAYEDGDYFGARSVFSAPIWPVYASVLIGSALVAVEFGLQSIKLLLRNPVMSKREIIALLSLIGGIGSVVLFLMYGDASRPLIGAVFVFMLVGLIVLGMHIPVAVILIGAVGVWVLRDNPNVALRAVQSGATGTINNFAFGVVPLFVLMGLLLDKANIGRDAFRVAAWTLRNLPGGLPIATVAANAVFAAVTGISVASAAVFSRVAVPQMIAAGFDRRFAAGTVAGSSVLGMLIPPSLLLIIFGFVSETSVGKLFVAAVVPGLLLATAFCITIVLMVVFFPKSSTVRQEETPVIEPITGRDALFLLLPIASLIFVVLGGIYLGWFTPTQAGAIGAACALLLSLARRALSLQSFWQVLKETSEISVIVLILIVAASVLTKMLAMSTIPTTLIDIVVAADLGFWTFMICYILIIVFLGMILDSTSIILIMVPLVMSVVVALGTPVVGPDVMIWFGIVTVIAVEIGLLTPPFGITVYVVRAALPPGTVSLGDVFVGVAPFIAAMVVVTLLLTFFPSLSLIGI